MKKEDDWRTFRDVGNGDFRVIAKLVFQMMVALVPLRNL